MLCVLVIIDYFCVVVFRKGIGVYFDVYVYKSGRLESIDI